MQLQTVLCCTYNKIFVPQFLKSNELYITSVLAPLPPGEKFWMHIWFYVTLWGLTALTVRLLDQTRATR
jgi:hypothetical protein